MDRKASISINNFDNHMVIRMNDESNLIDHVPAMVYKASIGRPGIIMVKDRPNFTLPQLRFGKHNARVKQITASYDRFGKSNGVLLHGMKGSGKSLLAEELGNWMIAQDLPVIMVTEPMGAEELGIIIKAIGPCMVYFDEFGKVYDEKPARERLLSLFSDTSFQGVMFVITGNESEEFSDYLVYRPQRFRYNIGFGSTIDLDTLHDIMGKMQVSEHLHPAFEAYVKREGGKLNFDSLLCVIRESAGCKDALEVADVCEILNVPDFPRMSWYVSNVEVTNTPEEYAGFGYHVQSMRHSSSDMTVRVNESRKAKDGFMSLYPGPDPEAKEGHLNIESLAESEGKRVIEYQGYRGFRITLSYGFGHEVASASLMATEVFEGSNGGKRLGMGRSHSEAVIDSSNGNRGGDTQLSDLAFGSRDNGQQPRLM
jgi:hypothetical protein